MDRLAGGSARSGACWRASRGRRCGRRGRGGRLCGTGARSVRGGPRWKAPSADQPGRPQRPLPLHRGERARDHVLADRVHARAPRCARAGLDPPKVWRQSSTATTTPTRTARRTTRNTASWAASSRVAGHVEVLGRRLPRVGGGRGGGAGRTVFLRSAMVMSLDRGGVFDTSRRWSGAARRPRGPRPAVRIVDRRGRLRARRPAADRARRPLGPVNLAAPEPAALRRVHRALRPAAGVRFGLTAPRPPGGGRVRASHGDRTGVKRRRVAPGRLLEAGFESRTRTGRRRRATLSAAIHRRSAATVGPRDTLRTPSARRPIHAAEHFSERPSGASSRRSAWARAARVELGGSASE